MTAQLLVPNAVVQRGEQRDDHTADAEGWAVGMVAKTKAGRELQFLAPLRSEAFESLAEIVVAAPQIGFRLGHRGW